MSLFTSVQELDTRQAEVIAAIEDRLNRVGNLLPRTLRKQMRRAIARYHRRMNVSNVI